MRVSLSRCSRRARVRAVRAGARSTAPSQTRAFTAASACRLWETRCWSRRSPATCSSAAPPCRARPPPAAPPCADPPTNWASRCMVSSSWVRRRCQGSLCSVLQPNPDLAWRQRNKLKNCLHVFSYRDFFKWLFSRCSIDTDYT